MLIGKPVYEIGRAADLVWLQIGEKIKFIDSDNRNREVSVYSLHIQCSWRIVHDEKIILSFRDFYEASSTFTGDPSNFEELDSIGALRFDEISTALNQTISSFIIEQVTINELGDIVLELPKNYRFECYADNSLDEENWRLIKTSETDSQHYKDDTMQEIWEQQKDKNTLRLRE